MKRNLLLALLVVISGLLGGAISNLLLMAHTSVAQEAKTEEKLLWANKFRLVDLQGMTRAMLTVGEKGNVSLNFYDSDTKNRIILGLSPEGWPVLTLFDEGAVELLDKKGLPRARISILPDGSPSLKLYDQNGIGRVALGRIDLETPETKQADSVEKREESSLVLSNKEGTVIWSAP